MSVVHRAATVTSNVVDADVLVPSVGIGSMPTRVTHTTPGIGPRQEITMKVADISGTHAVPPTTADSTDSVPAD